MKISKGLWRAGLVMFAVKLCMYAWRWHSAYYRFKDVTVGLLKGLNQRTRLSVVSTNVYRRDKGCEYAMLKCSVAAVPGGGGAHQIHIRGLRSLYVHVCCRSIESD